MKTSARQCGWCGGEGSTMICTKCRLVDYCEVECQTQDWKAGHKILCAKLPKAVKKAKEKVASFSLSDYTTRNVGTFMVTEAEARRGQILEERAAQDICYDAMDMTKGSTEKLIEILHALGTFPLSTEAWGMLGHFYQFEVDPKGSREKLCCAEALKMHDTAILCARKLNPTWSDDRSDELSWGEIENRPYLRALLGRAQCLKNTGKRDEAIRQAKKIMRLNPGDNQGVRKLLCSCFLEARDTEGCTNLLRKFDTKDDACLAYTDVLLQYLRWMKDDVVENDVRLALYTAIQTNPFVPDMLERVHGFEDDDADEDDEDSDSNDGYYSIGGSDEAKMYAKDSRKLWKKYHDAISWMRSLKFSNGKIPEESDLIDLLRSGVKLRVKCIHTDIAGSEEPIYSTFIGTQRRNACIGCGLPDFYWPRQLNQPHQPASDILIHDNAFDTDKNWRRTDYVDIEEVPYWAILLQFYADDEDYSGDYRDEPKPWKSEEKDRPKYENSGPLKCKECGSAAKFYALDNDSNDFYCSKSCMKNFLEETAPLYLELDSETFNVHATEECSVRTIDLDHALQVARDYMPNLKYVDIFINQDYILEDDTYGSFGLGEPNPNFMLSSHVLEQFLESKSADLVAFVFHLDDCCWEEIKALTDRCRAFAPLARMPNLKKLSLTNFGFDDVETITMCLNPGLESLRLDQAAIGFERIWSNSQVDALVSKLFQLPHLVSLSLSGIPITDSHVRFLLPRFNNQLKCLHLRGDFGDPSCSPLTDNGVKAIAEFCPSILTVDVDYQDEVGFSGILALVQNCPNLLEIGACGTSLGVEDVSSILSVPNELLNLSFGEIGHDHSSTEKVSLQNAVMSTNGRLVICTMSGLMKMNLPPEHKANQDDSMSKIKKAHEQQFDPMLCNKWDGEGW
ncbi:hypothetical protein QTG54_000699 [Skeletonema marinoi]|uniref:MYND-type domain-containing protein n=1 Tax=Skeletonema marinoi TaxID=267567 RepID=A0AAD8YP90_9STRA|nr:hypothetical protein QTG54_000699 [Skeletonema marinoi]